MFCATEGGSSGDTNACFSNEDSFPTVNYLADNFFENVYISK